jgi:hypothetical protein
VKKLAAFCLLLVISLPAAAVEDGQVMYAGGTILGMQAGVLGHLDATSETMLMFEYAGNKLAIPFAQIVSFEYSEKVARHLGVLPAIAVGLVKKRQRRHFFQISFHDESNSTQVAVFEVSKHMPQTLLAVLQNRSPQACQPSPKSKCDQQK